MCMAQSLELLSKLGNDLWHHYIFQRSSVLLPTLSLAHLFALLDFVDRDDTDLPSWHNELCRWSAL